MFKPAELVTIPTRPCKPTDMAPYEGLRQANWASTKDYAWAGTYHSSMIYSVTAKTGIAANEFMVDGEYGGGWGSWTMGLLVPKKDYAKSFGLFGKELVATGATPLDHSYNQQQLNMCNSAKISTAGFCASDATVSLSKTVLIVSVWANDAEASAVASSAKGLQITFKLSAWADHSSDWAAPAVPSGSSLATDPKVFDGAKALAVSTAAILTLALY